MPSIPSRMWPRHEGTLSLPQLWHLLAGAALVVCPDTGIAHLARLTGVPTVALFGPGSALLSGAGAFWRDSPFTAVTIADFPCRDQRITMKRDVAWIRRCERFPGHGARAVPRGALHARADDEMVWRAAAQRLGIAAAMRADAGPRGGRGPRRCKTTTSRVPARPVERRVGRTVSLPH